VDDLGADSLDLVELIMALEEEFTTPERKVSIPDEDAEKIITVQDGMDYVRELGVADNEPPKGALPAAKPATPPRPAAPPPPRPAAARPSGPRPSQGARPPQAGGKPQQGSFKPQGSARPQGQRPTQRQGQQQPRRPQGQNQPPRRPQNPGGQKPSGGAP
jgi:hypothetical protein